MAAYDLAQVNVGRLLAPIDAPETAAFFNALDPVNALADTAPGFLWRLQTEDGNATAVRVDDDPLNIVNLSVWESMDALTNFVYRSAHTDVMRRRAEWFHRAADAYVALWWVPTGHRPTVTEAIDRLERLRRDGPTQDCFTFRTPFPAPSVASSR
ncbi:MAG: hypothetical protein QOI55_1011 [Actinomycetota bacterium]|nr:hypothetical protein [Actinomycetota bacterium]